MSAPSVTQAADPALPNRTNPIRKMTADEARTATTSMLVIAAMLLVGAGLLWRFQHPIAAAICGVLAVVLGASAFAKKTLISSCPFCGAMLTGITEEAAIQGRLIRCEQCFEYSQTGGMTMRPADPNRVADEPKFISPVFERALWPQGCVQCGEPATRMEDLKHRSIIHPGSIAVGRLWLGTATMKNVPYCAEHKDAIQLVINQSKQVDLRWRSLRMMRRYLAMNRGRKSLGSKVHFNIDKP